MDGKQSEVEPAIIDSTAEADCFNISDSGSEAIQKDLVLKAVSNTEKEPVKEVEMTAPGLAVVSYGREHINKVAVTFLFDCPAGNTPEEMLKNPTGFRVVGYSQLNNQR